METNNTDVYEVEKNWLETEEQNLQSNTPQQYEKLPALKMEENKIYKLQIDFSKPFEKWNGENKGKPVVKAIIPLMHENIRKNFWLNVRNPLYRTIVTLGRENKTEITLMQIGNQSNTKYVVVK